MLPSGTNPRIVRPELISGIRPINLRHLAAISQLYNRAHSEEGFLLVPANENRGDILYSLVSYMDRVRRWEQTLNVCKKHNSKIFQLRTPLRTFESEEKKKI